MKIAESRGVMPYSNDQEVDQFQSELGSRPFFVCDMDGNVMTGYSLVKGRQMPLGPDGKPLPLDNPATQSIPFGTTPEQIAARMEDGTLREGVFAEKAMDARLPLRLVERLNQNTENGDQFSLGFLTSRSAPDALILLKESGVHEPERVTLVADSGATLYADGRKTQVRQLSDEEQNFLNGVKSSEKELNRIVRKTVSENGFDASTVPSVYIEPKGIATNVHYREILTKFGQKEGSPFDEALGAALKTYLSEMVANGPKDGLAKPVFKTLDGPATVEVKVAEINKGHGLEALARAAMAADSPPTSIVFSGDDVSKGNGTPGTDYFAMARKEELSEKLGIPFFNVHTHHPENGDLTGTIPDPKKSPSTLSDAYPAPSIDLVVPTPRHNGDLIESSLRGKTAAQRITDRRNETAQSPESGRVV